MNLASVKTIKELLKQNGLKPLKQMGQNFLISGNVVDNVVSACDLKPTDTVLEIGPGLGVLTIKIAEKVKRVIAVEKDRGMASLLNEILEYKNVKIINNDILKYQNRNKKYKVISNLPYNIATAVIMQFLEAKNPPELMVVMLQKEVAQRICAKPPHMSKLTVFTQFYSTSKIIGYVSKRSFYPQPKVDSAILKIIPRNDLRKKTNEKLFAKIVKAGFAHPRKQLINNLSKGLSIERNTAIKWISKNKIKPSQRAETLSTSNWIELTKSYP